MTNSASAAYDSLTLAKPGQAINERCLRGAGNPASRNRVLQLMFNNKKKVRKITGKVVRILFMSALAMGAIQRAESAVWTSMDGRVLAQTGEPVCAMVLANGQHIFSCDGNGTYGLWVPLDSSGNITLQVFATGFAPFRQTITAGQAVNNDVRMDRDTTGRAFTITHFVSAPLPNGWVTVSGTIHENSTPVCAMILINGQRMFSCNQDLGQYSLAVPRDSNGHITLQAFAAGFMPHRDTFGVNDPPIATGQCDTTFQADTYSGVLNATDPESALLTYALIDPDDGTSAGTGPIITPKGGKIEITNSTTGDYLYTPDTTAGDKRGMDFFQYQVTDIGGLTNIATEVIIVNQTIMPLGDSITQGSVFNGIDYGTNQLRVGYRKPLFDTLGASGYTFDFVGSLAHGQSLLPDFQHEGHGGYTAFDIAWGRDPNTEGVFNWLVGNPADIILLHAGTNDLINTNVTEIEDILNEIDRWEDPFSNPGGNPVTVILALIIDQDSKDNPLVAALNDDVKAMANNRIAGGDNIIIVDQHKAVDYLTDMSDNLHPTDEGYAKMTPVWYNALENVLDKCP
jgi:hypothetical protein